VTAFRILALAGVAALAATLPVRAATIEVTISKFAFSPAEITAKPGDVIEWTNKDAFAHTATAKDKSFDVSVPANGKGTLTVPDKAGAFDYFCRFHPMMKGKLTVAK